MAAGQGDATERLLNLAFVLLSRPRGVSRGTLREVVPGYGERESPSEAAFARLFERDKDALRALGLRIRARPRDGLFDDEIVYEVDRAEEMLPALELSAEEWAVLRLAAAVWRDTVMGPTAALVLRKLEAAGAPADAAELPLRARLAGADEQFADLLHAVTTSRIVHFGYQGRRDGSSVPRVVEPWSLLARRGAWYLIGHDRDRGAMRVFRLSRVRGGVRISAQQVTTAPPAGLDLARVIEDFLAGLSPQVACLSVAPGRAGDLRRRAQPDPEVPDRFTWEYREEDITLGTLAAEGPAVVVLEPARLREGLIAHLRAVAEANA
ncbi:MAG: WYL domain-containing protein [Actinomycetales bacterium]|nr:WYL domain-containing protein [Actinomycetales bacterium]